MRYERPELRFTLRDGARFAAYLQSIGVDATKLLIDDPAIDKPDSPLLKVASQVQWGDPEWWKAEAYDLVVMYGRPLAAIKAIRTGSPDTVLCLKMDAGYGIITPSLFPPRSPRSPVVGLAEAGPVHTESGAEPQRKLLPTPYSLLPISKSSPNRSFLYSFIEAVRRRYPYYRYVQERSFLHALVRSIANVAKNSGPAAIARQKELFSLPHHILYESPMALEETAQWFTAHGVPEYAKKLVLASHPIPDTFTLPSPSPHTHIPTHSPRVSHSVIGVADWTASSKDAPLFAHTMAIVMSEIPDATLCLAGKGSTELKRRIITTINSQFSILNSQFSQSRIEANEFVHPDDMPRKMQQAQVYLGTSKCESFGISVAESLCCGCSVALAPGIGVPSYRYFASDGSGTQASSRTPAALATAVKHEFTRWQSSQFDPAASAAHWSPLCHTPSLIHHICEVAGLSL